MKTPVDLVIKNLEEAITCRRDAVTKGPISSFEEYKYLTGVIAGLQAALDAVKAAQKQYEED